jgi:phosphatidylglycerophosphatase A
MAEAPRAARWIATWFGCGRSPIAPGTVGALGALPLHFVLRRLSPGLHLTAVLASTALGIWAAGEVSKELDDDDPESVVIDEVVGTLIALGMVAQGSLRDKLIAFSLFRALDIIKPGVIDRVQHAKPEGLGIMADDLIAGVCAGLTAYLVSARRG